MTASTAGRMTEQRARDLIHELDHLRPTEVDHLTSYERATYRRAIDLHPTITDRHRTALLWAIRAEQETR
jgi:hypothetical protein